ncbi:MAG: amino acid ABC transporter substrate-binding protein [Clostridiales bacterium]|nr:amino acid ABC transporter substrate-binding protein [Clostridiales bacterium]
MMRTVKVCADPFPPYQYVQEDGSLAGSDYELVFGALTKAGYKVEAVIAPWDEVMGAFEKKECDALFQVQDTPARRAAYCFSEKLRDAVTDVVKLQGKDLAVCAYDDLKACRLGLISGFANGADIDSLPESCKRYYNGTQEILDALYAGEIDAAVCDRGVREYLTNKDEQIVPIAALTYKRPLYVMFYDGELRDAFNEALQQL